MEAMQRANVYDFGERIMNSLFKDFNTVLKDMSGEDKILMIAGVLGIIALIIGSSLYAERKAMKKAEWTHFMTTHEVFCDGRNISDLVIDKDYYNSIIYRDLDNTVKSCAEAFTEIKDITH